MLAPLPPLPRWVVTFECRNAGFGMTIGSNESTKARAFSYAARCWRASAPAWASDRLTSVSVMSGADHDNASQSRERAESIFHPAPGAPRYI